MRLKLNEIASAVQGRLIGKDVDIHGVSIDTRTLKAGELYVALRGKNLDGHDFIGKAEQARTAAVMVEKKCVTDLPVIMVEDSRLALAELARFWRGGLPVKIAAVTGSNGKTTVKEMIAAILNTQGRTLFTQGNLNNDIGVPLTLLKLDESYRFGVIEMGANHPGEIAYSSSLARADVGLITNVGAAHIEGFGSQWGVSRAKGEIIESLGPDGVAILNRDDVYYDFWRDLAGKRKTVSFGFAESADFFAERIATELTPAGFETRFFLKAGNVGMDVELHLAGDHNVKNALAAAAAAVQFGVDLQNIKFGLEKVRPVTGRLEVLRGRMGNIVIDDTYNANPTSLKAALDVLKSKDTNWLIMGAFGELGVESASIHREMGELIRSMPVERLFAVGALAKFAADAFGKGGRFFDSQEQLISALRDEITGREILLVKGSRAQRMENVVAAMVENYRVS